MVHVSTSVVVWWWLALVMWKLHPLVLVLWGGVEGSIYAIQNRIGPPSRRCCGYTPELFNGLCCVRNHITLLCLVMLHVQPYRAHGVLSGRKWPGISSITVSDRAFAIALYHLYPSGFAILVFRSMTTMSAAPQGRCFMAPKIRSIDEVSSGSRWKPKINQRRSPILNWKLTTIWPCWWCTLTKKCGDSL